MVEGYMKQLVKYLEKNLAKGYTLESLKWALVNQGYSRSEVNRAIRIVNEELAKKAPKLKEKPIIKVRREPILEEVFPEKPTFSDKLKNFWRILKDVIWS
jgi:hypothetical protein